MRTIKVAFYEVKIDFIKKKKKQPTLEMYSFEETLKELATKLNGNTDKQVIDKKNGLETSIWFDYLNYPEKFDLKKYIFFLLAKDVKSIMREDKKNKKLAHEEVYQDNIRLKIPAHFVYFPEKKILGVEELENAPTKSVIKKGIKEYSKMNVKFSPINRENIIERLITFQEAIENVEFEMKNLSTIMKNSEPEDWIDIIANGKKGKFKIYMETEEGKKKTVNLFSKLFKLKRNLIGEKEIFNHIKNMKVNFKNENYVDEMVELINNFLVFKQEREIYIDNLDYIEDNILKRIEYSKSIYKTIIDFYNEYFHKHK